MVALMEPGTILFGSTRQSILAMMFLRPGESFYLREIVRRSGRGTGSVQRELKLLTDCGILRRDRQRFYQANPDSPINAYRDGTTARVQVQAITFLKRASGADDLAQVRFIRGVRPGGNGQEQLTHYIATVQYGYGTPSHDDQTRSLNPLGFRVLEYRREAEVAADTVVGGATP